MEKTNTLSDGKDTLKETTHGNLKKIYKMQAKSCRNIFRVYQKQDNFSIELEPREGYHDLAKQLSHYLYFFSFLFFSYWTYNYKMEHRKVSRDFVTISQ